MHVHVPYYSGEICHSLLYKFQTVQYYGHAYSQKDYMYRWFVLNDFLTTSVYPHT